MTRYVDWMRSHRTFNIILVIIYYIAVVAPHKRFGTFLNKHILVGITKTKEMREHYNELILLAAVAVLVIYIGIFIWQSLKRADKHKLWAYMLANVVFAWLIIKTLFVINTEVVHFPQYAAFALLIFPFTRNYLSTLIWTTIAGIADEAYQNFYLAPADTGYFDWNDVVTNLVGAVFGLLLIRAFGFANQGFEKFWKTSAFYGICSLIVLVIILHLSGVLAIGPDFDYPYQLMSKELTGFWQTVFPDITYHVIMPLEGVLLTFGLWGFYSRLGR